MKSTSRTLLVTALLLGAAAAVTAQSKTEKRISDPVVPGSNIKYADLVKLLFADFSEDERTATRTIPLRHVSGDHEEISLTGHFEPDRLDALTIRDKRGPIVIVQLDLAIDNDLSPTVYAGEASILAAFRLSPRPRLVDALDIKTDRWTEFVAAKPVLPIGRNQDAVVLVNNHFNSSQDYDIITAFFVDRNRLKPMFDMFLLNSRGCGATIDETFTFSTLPDPGKEYFKVAVKIQVKRQRDDPNCVPRKRGYSRYYRGTYVWNRAAGEFRLTGGNLALFDKFNQKDL